MKHVIRQAKACQPDTVTGSNIERFENTALTTMLSDIREHGMLLSDEPQLPALLNLAMYWVPVIQGETGELEFFILKNTDGHDFMPVFTDKEMVCDFGGDSRVRLARIQGLQLWDSVMRPSEAYRGVALNPNGVDPLLIIETDQLTQLKALTKVH